jgi:serine/threonine-protein kinase
MPEIGRYELKGLLGKGGFASVFRAWDPMLERHVALKALLPHLIDDPGLRERFVGEARAIARLHHPCIVDVYEVGEADGRPYFTMELVEGPTLAAVLASEGRLTLARTAALLRELCSAVDHLHTAGFVHRDIKLTNVMLDDYDRVVLMDFGIARAADRTGTTQAGMILGTPEAMAPEQVRGAEAGPAADVYALGVLTYTLLAGRPPFTGEPFDVLHAQVFDPPPPLLSLVPDLPEPACRAIETALAKDPAGRQPRAADLADALADVLAAMPTMVPQPIPHGLFSTAAPSHPASDTDASPTTQPAAGAPATPLPGAPPPMPDVTLIAPAFAGPQPAGAGTGGPASVTAAGSVSQPSPAEGETSAPEAPGEPAAPTSADAPAPPPAPDVLRVPTAQIELMDLDDIDALLAQASGAAPPPPAPEPEPIEEPLPVVRTPAYRDAMVSTVAGSGVAGFSNGPVATARLDAPVALALGRDGTLYVSDAGNHVIRAILHAADALMRTVQTVIGARGRGYADGPQGKGRLAEPRGLAVHRNGDVFIADHENHRLRRAAPNGALSTVAGSGVQGVADGQGTLARLARPRGVAVNTAGVVYLSDEHTIRRITPDGQVTTIAGAAGWGATDGHGDNARFTYPWGICFDLAGNIIVADTGNHLIRRVTPNGDVDTLAGTGRPGHRDGPADGAEFREPRGVAVDTEGNVFVADTVNHAIRCIAPDGAVTTVAGDGTKGFADGPAFSARFNRPYDVAAGPGGILFVADESNNRVRMIVPRTG